MSLSRQVRRAQERKNKGKLSFRPPPGESTTTGPERLVAAALIRNGVTESRGFKEHWRIRAALGDADPYQKNPADEYGFLTSTGRFVTRTEALPIAVASGQCRPMSRELLSSDINW